MTSRLRDARPEDLDALTAVFLACWRARYAGLLPEATVAAMDADKATTLWRDALDSGAPVLVAELDGQVVGVTRCDLDTDDAQVRDTVSGTVSGTVHSLYVHPAHQGAGLGGTLLGAATARLREAGAEVAHLWVFAANTPSIVFYRNRGWEDDGATRTQEQFGELELRLRLPLTGQRTP